MARHAVRYTWKPRAFSVAATTQMAFRMPLYVGGVHTHGKADATAHLVCAVLPCLALPGIVFGTFVPALTQYVLLVRRGSTCQHM